MANIGKIKGLGNVLAQLKKVDKMYTRGLGIGLKKAGLYLQRASQQIVPVQTGNLKASAFTRPIFDSVGNIKSIRVGYTARYAIFVHERLYAVHGAKFNRKYAKRIGKAIGTKRGTAKGGWFTRGESQQAKFLERPLRWHKAEINILVRNEILKAKNITF